MNRCVIEASPEALRAMFGLPADAIVDGIGYSDKLGVVQLRVVGFGRECQEGQVIPQATVIVRSREIDGEKWFQSAAQMAWGKA